VRAHPLLARKIRWTCAAQRSEFSRRFSAAIHPKTRPEKEPATQ
jgi:hypothetical protein